MERYKVDFGLIPWTQPAAGVRYRAFEQDGRRLRLVEFTRAFTEADWCIKGHIGYVVEGEMEVDFRGNKLVFLAGDGLFIPPGDQHGHKAKMLTDLVRLILVENV